MLKLTRTNITNARMDDTHTSTYIITNLPQANKDIEEGNVFVFTYAIRSVFNLLLTLQVIHKSIHYTDIFYREHRT